MPDFDSGCAYCRGQARLTLLFEQDQPDPGETCGLCKTQMLETYHVVNLEMTPARSKCPNGTSLTRR